MRTPQGSEHTTCAKVVEARAVRLTGAVSIDRRKAGLRRRIEAVSDPAVFGHAFRNTKFGIGTAKRLAVVPLPRRLKKLPRGNGLLKLNASTMSAETTLAPRAETEFRGKATDLVLDLPRRESNSWPKRNTDGRA